MKWQNPCVSGLFVALLALTVQLTLVAAVPAATVSLAAATTLCHHDRNLSTLPARGHRGPARQPSHCEQCLICQGAAGPAGLPTASPVLPRITTIFIASGTILPPATAPPPRFVSSARPRGPPVPV
jgi:hypothetical protein